MACIYVRLPHYIASYLRNREEGKSIARTEPIRIEAGDPLMLQVELRAEPNLRGDVNVSCFSERQWVAMKQGKMLTFNDGLVLDRHRDPRKPLTMSEIYELCGRNSLIKYVCDDRGCKVAAPDVEYVDEYVPFILPSRIVRGGREVRVQSDWYIANTAPFISELRERFKMAFARFVANDQKIVRASGERREKMESIDRFMVAYDIRTGDREREQLKKVLNRMVSASLYSLENDDDHGRWHDGNYRPGIRQRGRPRRAVFCYDNGITYESVTAFAAAFGIKQKSQVTLAIQNHHRCHGMQIDYADSIPD